MEVKSNPTWHHVDIFRSVLVLLIDRLPILWMLYSFICTMVVLELKVMPSEAWLENFLNQDPDIFC